MTSRKNPPKSVKKTQKKPVAKAQKKLADKKVAPAQRQTLITLRAHIDSVEKRLKRADSLTRSSIKALKLSYGRLHEGDDQASLAGHVEVLSNRLNAMITQTRKDVAHDLQIVLEDPRLETVTAALTKANKRLTRAEKAQASAINAINSQIADLAIAVDERMVRETRAREEGHAVLTKRIDTLETGSSDAIKMIGEKVVSVADEITHRAKENIQTLTEAGAEQALSQQYVLEEYKSEMSRRIESLEDDQRNSIPSIERRLVTVTTRLETLEIGLEALEIGSGMGVSNTTLPSAELPPPPEMYMQEQLDDNIESLAQATAHNDAFSSIEPAQSEMVSNPYEQDAHLQDAQIAGSGTAQNPSEYAQNDYTPQVYAQPTGLGPSAHPPEFDTGNPFASRLAGTATEFVPAPFQGPVEDIIKNPQANNLWPPAAPNAVAAETATPPPMPLMQMEVPLNEERQTMDIARPGAQADTPRRKRKFRRKNKAKKTKASAVLSGDSLNSAANEELGGTPKNPQLKKIALMAGVALISVFTVKTIIPNILGSDTPSKQTPKSIASVETGGSSTATLPSLGMEAEQSNSQTIQTIEPTGDFAQASRQTPDLGVGKDGKPSAGKLTLEAAVKAGDPIAQFQSGLIHLEAGRDAEAVRLIRLAANQGQPAAQYRLAKMYEVGIGVDRDVNTAMNLLARSAKAGNKVAMHDVGHFYVTGAAGGSPDMEKAVKWFEMAAAHGFLDSQFNLGVLYQGAQDVEQDLEKSYIWYALAAKQGDTVAAQRTKLLARELGPDQLLAAKARVKAYAPKRQNNAANGVFKNLPWAPAAPQRARVNPSVKQAQELLAGLGYGVGTPDGAMGPKTRNAIISFERSNGLPETGRVNAALLDRLNLAAGV